MSPSNLLFQMSSHHSLQLGLTLGFWCLNRFLDVDGDKLFELVKFLELPDVQNSAIDPRLSVAASR